MSQVDVLPPTPAKKEREWLVWPEKPAEDKRPPIRWIMRARDQVNVVGMTPKEVEAIEGFLAGKTYLRTIDGRLHAYDVHKPLPDAEDDPICGPHWEASAEVKQWGGPPPGSGWHCPGLILTGLNAGISPNPIVDFKAMADRNQKLVEECGFVCLRSRRGRDGKYWEQWVLHGMMCAEGPLKQHLSQFKGYKKLSWHAEAEEACRFLSRDLQINFGSLDITVQRWALCVD
jgi:hypothetical protein